MHAWTVHGSSSSASARAGTDTSSTHHMLTRRRRARARLAVQVAYDARLPFGVDGYRADCRDYVFSEVLYIGGGNGVCASGGGVGVRVKSRIFFGGGSTRSTASCPGKSARTFNHKCSLPDLKDP